MFTVPLDALFLLARFGERLYRSLESSQNNTYILSIEQIIHDTKYSTFQVLLLNKQYKILFYSILFYSILV